MYTWCHTATSEILMILWFWIGTPKIGNTYKSMISERSHGFCGV